MNKNFFLDLRKFRRQVAAWSAFIVMSVVFAACADDDKSGTVHDPNRPVELTSFMPDSGRISEMVLLDGNNFGTDVSKIRVFFNSKEARVLGSTGTRILAIVPRLPGDTCTLSVEIDGKKSSYPGFFRYKIGATVSTIAGTGAYYPIIVQGTLDQCQFPPLYLGIDRDDNIFLTMEQNIIKLNVNENNVMPVANGDGLERLQINTAPDNTILLGNEGAGNRDFFYTMDPKDGWVAKLRYIKKWTQNGFDLPRSEGGAVHEDYETHHHCLYCYADDHYYTRYNSGHIVKINPKTWEAEIIYKTEPGVAYGLAIHPIRTTEMWLIYENGYGYSNTVCTFDLTDPKNTFKRVSSPVSGGHRDGPLSQARFQTVRQINFDSDGNLFIGDGGNHCVRKIDTETMMVETVIGIPGVAGYRNGPKEEALFNGIHGIVTDAEGIIYVSDFGNGYIRRIAIE